MKNKTLTIYKDRLINFSGRNQSLCRNKLYPKRAFDLVKLNQIINNSAEKILFSLIKNDYKIHRLLSRIIDIKLTKKENDYIEHNYLKLLDKKNIKSQFLNNKKDEILKMKAIKFLKEEKLSIKIAFQQNLSKNLDVLFNTIDAKERESGLYELYIGYPFVEGKLLDGKAVRAPLFLFPSSIFKKDGEWYYQNLNKEKIYSNKAFLLAYKDSNEISIDHIEEEYEEVEEFFKIDGKIKNISGFIEECKKWGNVNNIRINNDHFSDEFEMMGNYKKDHYEVFKNGDLILKNQLILGQYSVGSNGIYKDIEKMIEDNELSESVKSFLNFDTEVFEKSKKEGNLLNKFTHINENDSFFVTELDYSQEKAVKMAEKLDNLVIYGPPGTGKSQVIANIVSDYLAKGKKVLVVSEKRTALDVVYKRLEKVDLHSKLAFVHDSKKDRQIIMEKIIQNYEKALEKTNIESFLVSEKSKRIQKKIELLDKLAKELHLKRNIGVSLYKLYTHSKFNDDLIEDISSNFDYYNNFDFDSLNNLLKKLNEIENYVEYDNSDSLISFRKDFSNLSSLEERDILKKLNQLNQKLHLNSHLGFEKILKLQIEKLDIEKNWKINNEKYAVAYDESEELLKEINEYEKLIITRKNLQGKLFSNKEIEEFTCNRISDFLNEMLEFVSKSELMNQILNYEDTYFLILKNKKILDDNIFDTATTILADIIEYEKCFFVSLKKFRLWKKLKSFFPSKTIRKKKYFIQDIINNGFVNLKVHKKIINNNILEKKELFISELKFVETDILIFQNLKDKIKKSQNKIESIMEWFQEKKNDVIDIENEVIKCNGFFYVLVNNIILKEKIKNNFFDEIIDNKKEILEKIIR